MVLGGSPEEKEDIRLRFELCAIGIRTVSAEEATLLGSPLAEGGLKPVILEKIEALKRLRQPRAYWNAQRTSFAGKLLSPP